MGGFALGHGLDVASDKAIGKAGAQRFPRTVESPHRFRPAEMPNPVRRSLTMEAAKTPQCVARQGS